MMSNKKKGPVSKLTCSFCQKNENQVKRLVSGEGVYICNECIELCNELLAEGEEGNFDKNPSNSEIFSSEKFLPDSISFIVFVIKIKNYFNL